MSSTKPILRVETNTPPGEAAEREQQFIEAARNGEEGRYTFHSMSGKYFPKVAFGECYFDGHYEEAAVLLDDVLVGHTSEAPTYGGKGGRQIEGAICMFRPRDYGGNLRHGFIQPGPSYGAIIADDTQSLQNHIRRLIRRG